MGLSISTCLQNGVCSVEREAMIVKAGFRFFRSIFDLIPNLIKTYLCGAKNGKEICYRIFGCGEMGV